MKLKFFFIFFLLIVTSFYLFKVVAIRSYKAGAGYCVEQRRVLTDQEFLDAVVEKIVDKSKQKNERKEGVYIQYNSVGEFYQKTRQHYGKLNKAYYEINRMPEGKYISGSYEVPILQRAFFGAYYSRIRVAYRQFLNNEKPYSSVTMWLDECANIRDFQFYESGNEGSALPVTFKVRGYHKDN